MQFRNVLLVAVASIAAHGASAQTCDPEAFESSCNTDGSIQFCDDTDAEAPVEASVTCTEAVGIANGGACSTEQGCVGTGCGEAGVACEAPIGGGCIGAGVQLTQVTTDDDLAFSVLCAGDATCVTGVSGTTLSETCVAHLGPTCAAGSVDTCVGNVLVFCLGNADGTVTLTANAGLDCAQLIDGGSCGKQPCECDAHCGTTGTCGADGFCEAGVNCVGPIDSADCTAGGGEGEGEGEGEGNGGGGRDDEPEAEPAGGCASTNVGGASFAGLVLALVAVRRRRR